MEAAVDRLRFAVRFAGEKLDRYNTAEWARLRDDLNRFLHDAPGVGGITVLATKGPLLEHYTTDGFRALQRDTKTLLQGLTLKGSFGGASIGSITASWMTMRFGSATVPLATSTVRDAFLLLLLFLLSQTSYSNVQSCPECKRLFWRVGRQLYCSRTCVNRVNVREWTRRRREGAKQSHKRTTKGGHK
jgi:hypothetical protein